MMSLSNRVNCLLAKLLLLLIVPFPSNAFEFHGYFRSGVGMSDNGSLQCDNPNLLGRLGNECESYLEVILSEQIFKEEERELNIETNLSYVTPQTGDFESIDGETNELALRELNVQSKGFLGIAPEATFWAGKEFYQRHDIHHLDFFYWDVSGPGAGVSGIDTGSGKLSVALMRKDIDDINGNIFDIRYADLKIGNSKLEIGLDYFYLNPTDAQEQANVNDDASMLLTAEFKTPLKEGTNILVVQYATEGYSLAMTNQGNGGSIDLASNGLGNSGFRVINWGLYTPKEDLHIAYAFFFGSTDNKGANTDDTIWHISARPTFIWSDSFRTYVEVGHFAAEIEAVDATQSKVTVAQVWAAGKSFWSRPELRLYVTYVTDGENETVFRGEDNFTSIGLQAEAWW